MERRTLWVTPFPTLAGQKRPMQKEKCHLLHQTFYTDLMKKEEENPLVKHMVNHYAEEDPKFEFRVDRISENTLSRQIGEVLLINSTPNELLMNSKTEFRINFI